MRDRLWFCLQAEIVLMREWERGQERIGSREDAGRGYERVCG